MIAITKLGDSGVLLPFAGLILLCLFALKARRTAVFWASAVAFCAIATLVAKISLQACLLGWSLSDLRSPSGHTSLSATVYGSFALVVAAETTRWRRALALGTGALLIAAIAASRIYVHAHTGAEVIVGLLIGAVCVAWFAYGSSQSQDPRLPWKALVLAAILAVVVSYGSHLEIEQLIRAFAQRLGAGLGACPEI